MMAVVSIYPHEMGRFRIKFPFNRAFIDEIKQYPGVKWAPSLDKSWAVSDTLEAHIREIAGDFGWRVIDLREPAAREIPALPDDLHPYQREALQKLLHARIQLVAFEMRMGKSRVAVEAAKVLGVASCLVVGPAISRYVWEEQFRTWWPEGPVPEAIETRKQAAEPPEYAVTSYALAPSLPAESQWDMIVVDESQNVKNAKARASKHLLKIRKANPNAWVVLLTGTPVTREPQDLWHQLHILQPDAWGWWPQFVSRYSNVEAGEFSKFEHVWGLNSEHQNELFQRLIPVLSRATKHDWAHLFPTVSTHMIEIKPPRGWNARTVLDYENHRIHEESMSGFLLAASDIKAKHAVEWAGQAQWGPAAVVTWRRDTAAEIAEGVGARAVLITGADTPAKRAAKIDEARKEESPLLVCTMKSIETAIDLAFCTNVLFAELYYSPQMLAQVLSRFTKQGNSSPVSIDFLVGRGTIDDAIISTLERRSKTGEALMGNTLAESLLGDGLIDEEDQQMWVDRILEVAGG